MGLELTYILYFLINFRFSQLLLSSKVVCAIPTGPLTGEMLSVRIQIE